MKVHELRKQLTDQVSKFRFTPSAYRHLAKELSVSEQTIRNAEKNPEKLRLEMLEQVANAIMDMEGWQ
jgi:hypothetical protein